MDTAEGIKETDLWATVLHPGIPADNKSVSISDDSDKSAKVG